MPIKAHTRRICVATGDRFDQAIMPVRQVMKRHQRQ
jgi:hypothetical protein